MAETFEFISSKKSKVKMTYAPSGNIKVSDKKAFQGYLEKVIDFIEIDFTPKKKEEPKPEAKVVAPKPQPKPKPKPVIAGLAEAEDDEETEEEETEVRM